MRPATLGCPIVSAYRRSFAVFTGGGYTRALFSTWSLAANGSSGCG